jgi:ElaB/YqjD/DUF883 family membrane-anchored ribosome-binding protein
MDEYRNIGEPGGQRRMDEGIAGIKRESQTRSLPEEAKREGRILAGEAKEEVKEVAGELRDYVEDLTRSGKDRIADRLHHVSEALHRAADKLEEEHEETTGRLADEAADRLDRVCDYLHQHEPMDLINEADRFARRQPLVFIGGAILAGLVLGRFARSTSRTDGQKFDERRDDGFGPVSRMRPAGVGAGASAFGEGPRGTGEEGPGGAIGAGRLQDRPFTSRPLTEPPGPGGVSGGGI